MRHWPTRPGAAGGGGAAVPGGVGGGEGGAGGIPRGDAGSAGETGQHRAGPGQYSRRSQSRSRAVVQLCSSQQALTTLVTPAFRTSVPLMYCTTHLEDASGTLHFQSASEASL
eukprot:1086068-Prorocentrum_minimum.AAC.1